MPFDRAVLISVASLVVALLAVGIAYNAFTGLNERFESLSREVSEQSEALEELRRSLESQAEVLTLLNRLTLRVEDLELRLRQAATAEDVNRVAEELASLRITVEVLKEGLEFSNATLTDSIARLEERLSEVSEELREVSESLLFPVTLVDGSGERVVILERPSRVVSLAPSVTETLYFLGALELLVGVDSFSNFPPQVVELRENGSLVDIGGVNPSVEAILALRPDLVIGVASIPSHIALRPLLEGRGIPLLLLPDFTLEDVIESVIMAGRSLGLVYEAYLLAFQLEEAIGLAESLSQESGLPDPASAAIVWINPLFVVGGGTWEHDILEVAGSMNVYGNLTLWPSVSPETLVALEPQVIIVTSGYGTFDAESLVEYLESSIGEAAYSIPAVAEGRIYVLAGAYEDSFVRPSPRTILSLYVLLIIFHPDIAGLGYEDIPGEVTPDTLDVIELLRDRLPPEVLALLERSLSG